MPNKWVEPELAFEIKHEGNEIPVYHSYKSFNWNSPLTYWFTTDVNEESDFEFDIRTLVDTAEAVAEEAWSEEGGVYRRVYNTDERFAILLQKAIDEGSILVGGEDVPEFTAKETA